ncbi:MAG: chaperone modulator CbpM [Chitinophagaceae bacterium]|nr:chaperone modulator CbpM [Chitinophagaceae bacterium]
MDTNLIPTDECCTHYNIEISFIHSLHDAGLIEMSTDNDQSFVHEDQLSNLERFIRLHYDLNINMEGLEVISHMLQRIETLQQELISVQSQLTFYEQRELV